MLRSYKLLGGILLILLLQGCKADYSAEELLDCSVPFESNLSLKQLHEMAGETPIEIREPLRVSAVVISNDRQGNMFNELYLQNAPASPDFGIRIAVELRDSHLRFPVGAEVFVDLNGLWIQKKYGLLTLGKPVLFFGSASIGRIPYHEIDTYIHPGCESNDVLATPVSIQELYVLPPATWVQLEAVEFIHEEIGQQLASAETETIRNLTDCSDGSVRVITSGYADFYEQPIPDAHGAITGILLADRKGPYLKLRSGADIEFDAPRCKIPIEPVTSTALIISEIADPDNAPEARFVELYNNSEAEINLEGWQLVRYTNANTHPGSSTDLSGMSIAAKQTRILVADSLGFSSVFGFAADRVAGKNSAADSNGDDTILLIDPFDEIRDIFGRIGEDGSGTDHEFEDGRAHRKPEIRQATPVFSPSEWVICNDTGAAGTIGEPKLAPDDFTPGIRD